MTANVNAKELETKVKEMYRAVAEDGYHPFRNSEPMITKQRRTYTFVGFVSDVTWLVVRLPLFGRARLRGRLSSAFKEKLMLAVTVVNGCRYCTWAHAWLAARYEVPPDELASLLAGSIDRPVGDEEGVGLAFAQHYAESGSRPDADALTRLRSAYGPEMAGDILLTLRFITWGNLSGNTFRAFLERIEARRFRAPGLVNELLVFSLTAPIFGPAGWLMRRGGK